MKILFFVSLGTWFIFSTCGKKADTELANYPNPSSGVTVKADLTYLALGDSYTVGQSVEAYQSYPNQLIDQLKTSNKIVEGQIVAQTGWTTTDLIAAIKKTSLSNKYDFVSLLIGVNNQYRGYNINTYRKEFVELLQTSLNMREARQQMFLFYQFPIIVLLRLWETISITPHKLQQK